MHWIDLKKMFPQNIRTYKHNKVATKDVCNVKLIDRRYPKKVVYVKYGVL